MNPKRRRQQKALKRELRKQQVIDINPDPIISLTEAEIRKMENEAAEQGIEFEVIAGEEPEEGVEFEVVVGEEPVNEKVVKKATKGKK